VLKLVDGDDPGASERLLALLYDELRRLAEAKIRRERAGDSLQATALVHEAYLRLMGSGPPPDWSGRAHFFAAAAQAMRRILIERARRRSRLKHGAGRDREECDLHNLAAPGLSPQLLALDEALQRLSQHDAQAADLVNLRFFGGLTNAESAEILGISPRKASRIWEYSRAWLRLEIQGDVDGSEMDSIAADRRT
jgi:RNA polymerase sigma factor (TIGR02999 family)